MKVYLLLILTLTYSQAFGEKVTQCKPETLLNELRESSSPFVTWKNSHENDWSNNIHLSSSNGVEFEGIYNVSETSLNNMTKGLINLLANHPSEAITNVVAKRNLAKNGWNINFDFNGNPKGIVIHHETLETAMSDMFELDGIELSSHIIENQNDLFLLSELQKKFRELGVAEDSISSGLHNHIGLKQLLGRTVSSNRDPEILEFANDFEKVQEGLFEYFGTHPLRFGATKPISKDVDLSRKSYAFAIRKDNNTGEYTTIEMRYQGGYQDPEYIAESINFNNTFLNAYFDPNSGLKDWMRFQKNIKTIDLFEKLNLPYKQREYDYKALETGLEEDYKYLTVFSDRTDEATRFIGKMLKKNWSTPENTQEIFSQFFKYIKYLQEQKKFKNDELEKVIEDVVQKIKKSTPSNSHLKLLTLLTHNSGFKNLAPNLQSFVFEIRFKNRINKRPIK